MATSLNPDVIENWAKAIGLLMVLPPWIWMAVRTGNCLRFVTRGSIPYRKRTIWLIKILALIVGGGSVAGAAAGFGAPTFVAVVAAGLVVVASLTEKVVDVALPKPMQDPSAYRSAWQEYWRVRRVARRWIVGPSPAFVLLVLALVALGQKLPEVVWSMLMAICFVAIVASMMVASVHQWKWLRWRCPRCGCSFRGSWRWWMPKNCVYCGLPREQEVSSSGTASKNPLVRN
jgi:hypothetical protein